MSQKDTVVGYYQWGRKQKPNRGLSATVSPEAAQPQDSVSWVYKGQHSRVWTQPPVHRRQGQPVRLRLPAWRQGRLQDAAAAPRHRHQLHQRRRVGRVRPRPPEAARSPRSRPTTCRPAKGSHDLKVGFEYLLDIAKYAVDGRSGPIQYRDLNGATNEIRFVDVGDNAGSGFDAGGVRTIATSATPATSRTAGTRTTASPSPPASAGTTSVRTTWTASAIRSSRTC